MPAIVLLLVAVGASADEPASRPDPIFAAARAAVDSGQAERSKILGFHDNRHSFSDIPSQGGILVGFDLGLGLFGNIELVYALRPVFRTSSGEVFGADRGLFYDRSVPAPKGLKTLKSRVKRTVPLRAPAGYAVGGITVRSGLLINGLSLAYMRIDGEALDPAGPINSAWVGNRTGGSERSLDGKGAPLVGIAGSSNDINVKGLGLVFGKRPVPATPPPFTKKKAETKQPEKRLPEPPVEEVPEKPAPAPSPPKVEVPIPPSAAPASAPSASADANGVNWLPLAVFGLVAIAVALPLFVMLRSRKEQELKPSPLAKATPEAEEPLTVLPADANASVGMTATPPSNPRPFGGSERDLPVLRFDDSGPRRDR